MSDPADDAKTLTKTVLVRPVKKDDPKLHVDSMKKVKVGVKVRVFYDDVHCDEYTVASIGSIVLDRPSERDYPDGARVDIMEPESVTAVHREASSDDEDEEERRARKVTRGTEAWRVPEIPQRSLGIPTKTGCRDAKGIQATG